MIKLSVVFKKGTKSIREIASQVVDILHCLKRADPFFEKPVIRKEKFEDVLIDLDMGKDDLVLFIGSAVLEFWKKDIRRYDKVHNPDLDFFRDFGFSLLVCYKGNGRELSFTMNLGSCHSTGFGILSHNGYPLDYHINLNILNEMIIMPEVAFGSVKVSEPDYLLKVKGCRYPLGLVSYFSKGFELEIPMDLPGLEYADTQNGTMLSLPLADDFDFVHVTEDQKRQLIDLMGLIADKVPAYFQKPPGT